jgi:hypothetical protein
LYVAWIDRLFVKCFGIFHMFLTGKGFRASYFWGKTEFGFQTELAF